MIIEAQDNGYSVMIINDDKTRAFAYKNANDCKVTADILGMSVDVVALRRKALKREITPIKGSFDELVFSKLTRKQAENAIAEAEDAFFNENHWKREVKRTQEQFSQELIRGGLSYRELREMADYLERQYADDTARSIANKIRARVRCAEGLENEMKNEKE